MAGEVPSLTVSNGSFTMGVEHLPKAMLAEAGAVFRLMMHL